MEKKALLLDIDGVLADFYKGFASYLNKKLNINIDLDTKATSYDIKQWHPKLAWVDIDPIIGEWLNDDGFLSLPIYPGAQSFAYSLIDKYDVYIVTARIGDFKTKFSEETIQRIKDNTKLWLKKHGIPSNKLFFRHDKISFCKEHGINALIEDKSTTVLKAAKEGIYSILVARPWNHHGNDIVNWEGYMPATSYIAEDFNNVLRILDVINEQI